MSIYTIIINVLNWFVETIGVAIISLFLGFILANLAARLAEMLLSHAELNRIISKTGIKTDAEALLVRLVKISAYTLTCLLVLWHLGVLWYVTVAVLFVAILFCLAEILINLKDIIPNILFGFLLRRKNPFLPGDTLSVGRISGRVKNVYLTDVTVDTPNGDILAVPYWYLYRRKYTTIVKN